MGQESRLFTFLQSLGGDEAADNAHFAEFLIALRDELIRRKVDQTV